MAQAIMREAVSKENFELWNEGKPMRKQPVEEPPKEPTAPKIKSLKFDKIDIDNLTGAPQGRRKTILNEEKVQFMGFNVVLTFSDAKPVKGWMAEADYIKLKHELTFRDELNVKNME